ncbi:MAG TPA: hypothetical protein DCE42_22390 [Myxococcales bacterium]|nr:hypothetical protein [Deltaproteobacteria bacterium]MBU47235.1 hypothetical protein [Deltaproteobacteria bacterium]HAA57532.1 hypothetical protein [Myxococcales bacterium]|tara:strand:- start:9302 stop:9637 length:336 start_codon:yes stop_codon:yes gene_type:complete
MQKIPEFSKPEYEELVLAIHRVNQGWHLAQELFQANNGLSISFRERKHRFQKKLLSLYPNKLYLRHDTELLGESKIYSIRLTQGVEHYQDACHLPERIYLGWDLPHKINIS